MPSAVIREFRYQAETQRLLITFQSGRRYLYEDVPREIYGGLRAARSRGAYFNRCIRDRYACTELDVERGMPTG